MAATKEYLYVGHYYDADGNYILKIGTTNDLKRRRSEHNTNYRNSSQYTMPKENSFEYDWHLPLSKYSTVRYEDRNREKWQNENIGKFVRNDRFCCQVKPINVNVTIKKTYKIPL